MHVCYDFDLFDSDQSSALSLFKQVVEYGKKYIDLFFLVRDFDKHPRTFAAKVPSGRSIEIRCDVTLRP